MPKQYISKIRWSSSSVNGRLGEDDRGKTSPRALVFTRCDIQSERL